MKPQNNELRVCLPGECGCEPVQAPPFADIDGEPFDVRTWSRVDIVEAADAEEQ